MKRALVVALVGVPIAVIAAVIVPGAGTVIDDINYSANNQVSYINAAQCAGGTSSLSWSLTLAAGNTYGGGNVVIYASDTAPVSSSTSNGLVLCATQDDTGASPPVHAGPVTGGTIPAGSSTTQTLDVKGSDIVAAVSSLSCSTDNETIYVCAHWQNASNSTLGAASGKFVTQLAAPSPPTGVTAEVGDQALNVSWSAGTGTGAATDHYQVTVTTADPRDPAGTHASGNLTSTSTRISGLVNDVTYQVTVTAYSLGGNPASTSGVTGTPAHVANFYEYYKDQGGVEAGGCASGPAGAFALLGAAALLALRRRKP